MPTVSYDGQSLLVDGRRVWLVSGAIHYTRTPRAQWRSRIRAARQAGLNCVETYVFWNVHEPRPGVFDFTGENDLRHFIELIGQEGMYCILRPGPYICAEWDFGGLPPWLLRIPGIQLRQSHPAFMEATARYLGAVMEQVRDLQVTAPNLRPASTSTIGGGGGPILMMQAENEWFCHHPQQGTAYLGEIVRYLRENGCEVPINGCNNLWQRVEGTIDTWNGAHRLTSDLRQLRVVQPNAPRIITEFWPGWFDQWNGAHQDDRDADLNAYRLAGILAHGGQYNLYMFHGGTNFGFYGGRTVASPDCFMTTSYDYDAPLLEAGGRGPKYLAVKRLSTFASQFGQIFAQLDPSRPHAAIDLNEQSHPLSVVHQHGPAGQVVFLFKSPDDTTTDTRLILPNGITLDVPLANDRVAWLLVDANLAGVAHLDYTNLRPWAFIGRKILVLFGPAGAKGVARINGAQFDFIVPTAQTPLVECHEDLVIVVLSGEQVDAAYVTPHGLVVGAAGLDEKDQPLPLDGWRKMHHIDRHGKVTTTSAKPGPAPATPRLGKWEQCLLDNCVTGDAPGFAAIDGPQSLEALQCNFGYGWYRLTMPGNKPVKGKAIAPLAGDRLHLFNKGKLDALIGHAPGATIQPVDVNLSGQTVVLADNLGRYNYGWHVGERKGLFGHLYAVKPVKLGKPKVTAERAPDPFVLGAYIQGCRAGEHPPADALHWTLKTPAGGGPLILELHDLPLRAMIFINGKAVGLYDQNLSGRLLRLVLEPERDLRRKGANELKLALFRKFDGSVAPEKFMRVYESTQVLTQKAQWAFMPWSVPDAGQFRGDMRKTAQPCWYRTQFNVSSLDVPLFLEPAGMSKGQLILNGHNIGRYFVATADGKAVPPQSRYYLPEGWLRTDGPNELMLFDEHGKSPARCRLIHDAMGPYARPSRPRGRSR